MCRSVAGATQGSSTPSRAGESERREPGQDQHHPDGPGDIAPGDGRDRRPDRGPGADGEDEEPHRDHRVGPEDVQQAERDRRHQHVIGDQAQDEPTRRPGRGQQLLEPTCSPIDKHHRHERRHVEHGDRGFEAFMAAPPCFQGVSFDGT